MLNCFSFQSKSGNLKSKRHDDGHDETSTFDAIPDDEITLKIFKYLSVADLKTVRLVCKYWWRLVADAELLESRIISLTFKGQESLRLIKNSRIIKIGPCWAWLHLPAWTVKKSPLHGKTFRVNFHHTGYDWIFYQWLYWFNLTNIREVEFDYCYFPLTLFTLCISTHLQNIRSLSLSDTIILYFQFEDPNQSNITLTTVFKDLKALNINVTHPWIYSNFGIYHSVPSFLTLPGISALTTLNVKISDSGSVTLDSRGHFEEIFKSLGLIVKNNSKTLTRFSLSTYDLVNDRCCRIYEALDLGSVTFPHKQETPKTKHAHLFDCFLQEIQDSGWVDYGLCLQELNLQFRLIHLKINPAIESAFKPFLASLKNTLKNISLSQIYAQNREYFHEVFAYLPSDCKRHFIEVFSIRSQIADENGNDLQGLLEQYSTQTGRGLTTFRKHFDEAKKLIRDYPDMLDELSTSNTRWTVRFAEWKTLQGVCFFRSNLKFLTIIKVNHGYLNVTDKMKVTNEDLQTIIKSSTMLTELSFQYCDLLDVSDFGLTGIREEACRRMLRNRCYEPTQDDVIGVSLSNLKSLRLLKLSQAGWYITNVSVNYAFNRLKNLDSFKLEFVRNSYKPLSPLEFNFQLIRRINCNLPYQIETYESINDEYK